LVGRRTRAARDVPLPGVLAESTPPVQLDRMAKSRRERWAAVAVVGARRELGRALGGAAARQRDRAASGPRWAPAIDRQRRGRRANAAPEGRAAGCGLARGAVVRVPPQVVPALAALATRNTEFYGGRVFDAQAIAAMRPSLQPMAWPWLAAHDIARERGVYLRTADQVSDSRGVQLIA